jgi:hypothetical protein
MGELPSMALSEEEVIELRVPFLDECLWFSEKALHCGAWM